MTVINDLAAALLPLLIDDHRPDGTPFVRLADEAPKWAEEVVHAAHGDLLPDDYRYALIRDLTEALAGGQDEQDIRDNWETDVYNKDLLDWLASDLNRIGYCDEAIEAWGKFDTIMANVAMGQRAEMAETMTLLVEALEAVGQDEIDIPDTED